MLEWENFSEEYVKKQTATDTPIEDLHEAAYVTNQNMTLREALMFEYVLKWFKKTEEVKGKGGTKNKRGKWTDHNNKGRSSPMEHPSCEGRQNEIHGCPEIEG